MIERIRRLLGITEAEEDTVEAVARLHLRIRTLEADVARLDALVRQLAAKGTTMSELERRRFMRGWVQRNDPTNNDTFGLDA